MGKRQGALATAMVPAPRPPWPHPDLPDPRSDKAIVTAEVRVHWPHWAGRAEVYEALNIAVADAIDNIETKFKENE